MLPGGMGGAKALHLTMPSALPYWKAEASKWTGRTQFNRNIVKGFGGKTA